MHYSVYYICTCAPVQICGCIYALMRMGLGVQRWLNNTGHQPLSWTPPAGFPQSCSPLPATAPSTKLTGGGPQGLCSKPPRTAHVKAEFLWRAPATPGNAPNISSASSQRFGEQCRRGKEPVLCQARGVQGHTKTLCWSRLLLTYPSEGQARLGLWVEVPRSPGLLPDWGRPATETPPHMTWVSRGQPWHGMATWLERVAAPSSPPLGSAEAPCWISPS